ncbi:MAG TPA: type II toxin-antitoxin system ParD family antitoxin [Stellaceae bacterium]|jgi:antitoxin ParD1/3/4
MPSINLGDHFEEFVRERVARGRYQNASEVVRAGLRLLEEHEIGVEERVRLLKKKINEAWDDPRPSLPADEVFDEIEAMYEKSARPAKSRA